MGQSAYNSQLGRHSMGGPGTWVMLPSPGVPYKRGGASQGAQPDRLRSPKWAKAPRSEVADYPPTKGAKATRSARVTHLLLRGGCPARGRLRGGRGRGGAAQGKGVTKKCGSSQEQSAHVAQAVCGYWASGQNYRSSAGIARGGRAHGLGTPHLGSQTNGGVLAKGHSQAGSGHPRGQRLRGAKGPITRPRRGQKRHEA